MRAQRANKRRMTLRNRSGCWRAALAADRVHRAGRRAAASGAGTTIAEYGAVAATQGFVVLLLELPTGGFTDRSAATRVHGLGSGGGGVYVTSSLAHSVLAFALAVGWPGSSARSTAGRSTRGSSTRSTTTSRSRAGRSLSVVCRATPASSASRSPPARSSGASSPGCRSAGRALTAPYDRRGTDVRADPRRRGADARGPVRPAVGARLDARDAAGLAGLRLMWRSRVLRALVAVELFWGFGMVALSRSCRSGCRSCSTTAS